MLLMYVLLVNVVVFLLYLIVYVVVKKFKAWIWVVVVCFGFARGMSGLIIMGGSLLILNNVLFRDMLGVVNGFSGIFGNVV